MWTLLFLGQDWAALAGHWVRDQPCPAQARQVHTWSPWVLHCPVCARKKAEPALLLDFSRDARGRRGQLTIMCIATSASKAESSLVSLWDSTVPVGTGRFFPVLIQWSQMIDRTNKDTVKKAEEHSQQNSPHCPKDTVGLIMTL